MDSSDSDGDNSYLEDKCRKYVKALLDFSSKQKSFEEATVVAPAMPWEMRAEYVMKNYEDILWGLHDRPLGKMVSYQGIDELETFCNALCIGWKLWPDCWVGLQMILDYLAENTCTQDICRLNQSTIDVLNEIRSCKTWRNNPVCGPSMTAAQANCLLKRYKNKCSFAEATNNPMARMMGLFSGMGLGTRSTAGTSAAASTSTSRGGTRRHYRRPKPTKKVSTEVEVEMKTEKPKPNAASGSGEKQTKAKAGNTSSGELRMNADSKAYTNCYKPAHSGKCRKSTQK
jgi:hypothetical protein